MSTIKIGNRDFWEEAYQICSGHIAAIEKNKVRSIIKEPTPFEELKEYPIDLSSINSSFEKKATSDVKTSTKQFQTNAMNSPLTPTFYETPPSVLANSTKNKNVKVHEENVLSVDDNDLDLSGIPERLRQLEAKNGGLPVQNLQGIAATQGLPLEDVLRLPSKLPSLGNKNTYKKIGLSLLAAASIIGGGHLLNTNSALKLAAKQNNKINTDLSIKQTAVSNKITTSQLRTILRDAGTSAWATNRALNNYNILESVFKGDSTKPTGAVVNLFGEKSPLNAASKNIGSIRGYNVLGGHGEVLSDGDLMWQGYTPTEAKKYNLKPGKKITPEEAFEIMKKSPGYNPSFPTIILNCEAAKGTFAKRFAKVSKQPVIAGTEEMIFNPAMSNSYGTFSTVFKNGAQEINWKHPGAVLKFDKDGAVIPHSNLETSGVVMASAFLTHQGKKLTPEASKKILYNSKLAYSSNKDKHVGSYTNFFGEGTSIQHSMADVAGRRGFNTLVGHASPDGMFKGSLSHEIASELLPKKGKKVGSFLSAKQTAQEVINTPGYNKDLPLFVYGCRFAKSKQFSDLAKELNTPVYAFTERGFGTEGTFAKNSDGTPIFNQPGDILKATPDGKIVPMTLEDLK